MLDGCQTDAEQQVDAALDRRKCASDDVSTQRSAQNPTSRIADMKPAQVKPRISPEMLDQIDFRVGTILTVSDVPDSEKLIALEVSFGDHKRTVLVGMKRERANPHEIEVKQALFVVILPPRKMAGMVSEGMLFDIGYSDGITPVLATPETPVPDGTRAG